MSQGRIAVRAAGALFLVSIWGLYFSTAFAQTAGNAGGTTSGARQGGSVGGSGRLHFQAPRRATLHEVRGLVVVPSCSGAVDRCFGLHRGDQDRLEHSNTRSALMDYARYHFREAGLAYQRATQSQSPPITKDQLRTIHTTCFASNEITRASDCLQRIAGLSPNSRRGFADFAYQLLAGYMVAQVCPSGNQIQLVVRDAALPVPPLDRTVTTRETCPSSDELQALFNSSMPQQWSSLINH